MAPSAVYARDDSSSDTSGQNGMSGSMLGGIIVAIVFVTIIVGYLLLRILRNQFPNPRFIPTKYLKERWTRWTPGRTHAYRATNTDHFEPLSQATTTATRETRETREASQTNLSQTTRSTNETAAGIDRNTSVRSVMTLPAYNAVPGQDEQILGRAGERGGIDIVLEYPDEAAAVEEERREEEMNALYQVRVARRRENAVREEERQRRSEGRARGLWVPMNELESRQRAREAAAAVQQARAERDTIRTQTLERPAATSSVSYADLGVIRHDGTRLRANSTESERQGLLGDAASMATDRPSHHRQLSNSSVLSIDTNMSDTPSSPGMTRVLTQSHPETPTRPVTAATNTSGDMSSPELIEAERDDEVPTYSPPDYENIPLDTEAHDQRGAPPEYTSPSTDRATDADADPSHETSHTESSSTSPATSAPPPPSLRLSNLPSIVVDAASPVVRREDDDQSR